MEYAGGACCTGTLLAACGRWVCRRRSASRIATTAGHRTAVDDRDPQLILIHIDDPQRIVRDRSLRIERVFQHRLYVFVANVDSILGRLSPTNYGTRRNPHRQNLQGFVFHHSLLN